MDASPRLKILKEKLKQLNSLDPNRRIFGARKHKYRSTRVSEKALAQFEAEMSIGIPEELREFWLKIGTGAGPDYGLYNLKEVMAAYEEWAYIFEEDAESKLSNECELTAEIAEDLANKKLEKPQEFFFHRLSNANGIMPIQTQGCTYYTFIVVSGEQRGQVWGVDLNEFDCKPGNSIKTMSFFDWYEHWLDENIGEIQRQIKVGRLIINQNVTQPKPPAKRSWYKSLFKW